MPQRQPEQQAPPVQRVRIRYAKRGRLRFASHRDVSRVVERALVRARVPMAYSSGFHPHPRISYAGAVPTGAASEAEYLEIGLAERVEPSAVLSDLAAAMPAGIDPVAAIDSPGGSLADRLEASRWRVDLIPDAATGSLPDAVAGFLAATTVEVERMTKKGLRTFDCRAAVVLLSVVPGPDAGSSPATSRLDLVLRHLEPAVRPDDVMAGLRREAGLASVGVPVLTRLAQGPLDPATGEVGDPFDAR